MIHLLCRSIVLTLAGVVFCANAALGQSVRIQSGEGNWGYGWMFQHGGNCYAALPRHVAGEVFPKVTVSTAAPVVSDQAVILRPFWDGLDLAVAIIDRGVLGDRCTARLSDLRVTAEGRGATVALLTRVTPSGQEERLPLELRDRSYLTFEGVVTREGDAIGEGTSGAFAFVTGRPIGMAYETTGTNFARFMRAEEIAMNLERFLADQGAAFVAPEIAPPEATSPAGSFVLLEAATNTPPILPQYGPENLQSEGLYVVEPSGPVELTFRLDADEAQALSRVRLTAPSGGEFAVPKDVVIYLDAGVTGERFRFWTQGRMRPDGFFDTGPLAARNAGWLRIVISSAWETGPMAIDDLIVD